MDSEIKQMCQHKITTVMLALQLRFLFEMRFLCCGLMSAPPERPCDDIGGLNAFSRETLSYAADFLDRPTDEIGCLGVALDLVFLGVGLLARCWMAAIMAKPSMTSET